MTPNPQSKILIVDTEQYAGNFEREMCAFITGQVGECGVGDDIAEQYSADIKNLKWWEEHIVSERDDSDYGCYRPASIWPTLGWFNNGTGGHFKDTPENEAEAIEKSVTFMKDYNKGQVEMAQKRIKNNDFETTKNGWTKEACERVIKKNEEDIKQASKLTKYPAYMSVAIFVDEFPPQEVWEEFMERAKEFGKNRAEIINRSYDKQKVDVTGFRQVEPEYKLKTKKTKKVK